MDILKRHGLKLSISALLGCLIVYVTIFVGVLLFALLIGASLGGVFSGDIEGNLIETGVGGSLIIIGILCLFLLYIFIVSYVTGGLIGSVNDAVFRNQSTVGSFIRHGFKNFWETSKILLSTVTLFLVVGGIMNVFVDAIATTNEALAILIFLIYLLLLIPAIIATNHSLIISYEQNISAFHSIKAGFLTYRKTFGKNFASAIFAILSYLGIYVATILIILLLALIDASFGLAQMELIEGFEGSAFFGLIAILLILLMIPAMYITGQLVITIRFKDKIAPIVFPNGSPNQQLFNQQLYPQYQPNQQPFNQQPYPQQQPNQQKPDQSNQPNNPFNWG
ncbi:hypothetical protein [Baia soyae]|uniref:Glycerophosphoryl diester phosphodiesterase family protein n=1 Tax=Baia soyae TaxID=1544746 RepID=A0A4R2S284_9BACL|nr:hypothetical protein [Baia soyae]TCP66431.1 hypothetical protein EDD57_12410 [Baia soyae]